MSIAPLGATQKPPTHGQHLHPIIFPHSFCGEEERESYQPQRKRDLYKYITGIVTAKGQKMMYINGVEDHIHLLISTQPNCNLSDLVRDIKANSSKWVNEQGFVNDKFSWQRGFGAFTVSHTNVKKVTEYIINQEEHHRTQTFRKEYMQVLSSNDIDFDEAYIFDNL